MRYVIGVDGGQTSTSAVLADEQGSLLGAGISGPANHIHEPGGVERVRRSLFDAIGRAIAAAAIEIPGIACAYLGMTGGGPAMEDVCRPAVAAESVVLGHDSLIALYSVTFGRPGVVVIGGTGSVGFGRSADGVEFRTGGWGYLMGDEGSGYWIGLQALNTITRAADDRGPRTSLSKQVLEQFECETLLDLHRRLYGGEIGRPEIAGIASTVGRAASSGDRVSKTILDEAGRQLGTLATAVILRLRMGQTPVLVGMAGGVFDAGESVRSPFIEAVQRVAPDAQFILPRIPQAAAAALLALEHIGVSIDDAVLRRVENTLECVRLK